MDDKQLETAVKIAENLFVNASANEIATKVMNFEQNKDSWTYIYCRKHMNAIWDLCQHNKWEKCQKEFNLLSHWFLQCCNDRANDYYQEITSFRNFRPIQKCYIWNHYDTIVDTVFVEAYKQLNLIPKFQEVNKLLVQAVKDLYMLGNWYLKEDLLSAITEENVEQVQQALKDFQSVLLEEVEV